MTAGTAVVLNWNLADLTIRCVRALLEDGVAAEDVVVVDNGSADDSVDRLRAELTGVHVLALPSNIGYARASNAGARERPESGAYLFVNNDAFVQRPGSVALLLSALERPGVGIAVPRLLNEDLTLQKSVVPLRSPAIALALASGLSRLIPNRWQPHWSTHWDHSQSRSVDAVAGTVTAVRGDLWRRLGGYAEREIMFSEDIDLCWRARKLDFRTWFEHSAEFVHLGDASGQGRTDARRAAMVAQSDASMIRDELGRASAAATIGVLSFGYAIRFAFFTATRNKDAAGRARAALRGYLRSAGTPQQ
jgi:N-acetylglucosaminyl-diphospho-decaprenol L-rhamnosyltransferase